MFEAADIVDSNPINKGDNFRGLTTKGQQQVIETSQRLRALNVDPTAVFYDNGARASQTADILSRELKIPRARMEPEFRWLEGRGLGALEGTSLREALAKPDRWTGRTSTTLQSLQRMVRRPTVSTTYSHGCGTRLRRSSRLMARATSSSSLATAPC